MNLTAINKDYIRVSDLASALGVKDGLAKSMLDISTTFWRMRKYYVYTCPNCGKVLRRANKLSLLLGASIECDGPHEDVEKYIINREDIHIEYGK